MTATKILIDMVIKITVRSLKPLPYDDEAARKKEDFADGSIFEFGRPVCLQHVPLRKPSSDLIPPSTSSCVDHRDVMVDPASSRRPGVDPHPILELADRDQRSRSILLLHPCVVVLLELLERSTCYYNPLMAQRRCLASLRNSLLAVCV